MIDYKSAFRVSMICCTICICAGVAIGAKGMHESWKDELIKRGLMQHNPKTGVVEWIETGK
jgi:hypothetical protein